MENNLQVFNNDVFGEVRFVEVDSKTYAVANDIAKSLGYSSPKDAIARHCKGAIKHRYLTNGGQQEIKVIPEGDIYRLIVKSKLPEAEKFEQWVFEEVLPTIRKTGGFISNDDMFINTYLPFADDQTKLLFKGTLETVRKQNELIKYQQKEIEHKEDVIIGLVDEITLAEKRQIINRVVKKGGTKYSERWNALYQEFESKYHINLKIRLNTYNENNKPKLKNKIDYIDKVMNKIPELYEIACKLYENDVKQLVNEMYQLNYK